MELLSERKRKRERERERKERRQETRNQKQLKELKGGKRGKEEVRGFQRSTSLSPFTSTLRLSRHALGYLKELRQKAELMHLNSYSPKSLYLSNLNLPQRVPVYHLSYQFSALFQLFGREPVKVDN